MSFLRRTRSRAIRLVSLLGTDFVLVAQVVAWRVCLPVLRRTLPVRTLVGVMWSRPLRVRGDGARQRNLAHTRDVVSQGGRLLFGQNCLERSLIVYRLLARADANPTLVLAVRRQSPHVPGHAWVEVDGAPFGEPDVEPFEPVVAFGSHGLVAQRLGVWI